MEAESSEGHGDPGAGQPAAGDPAAAFDALRAEVARLGEAIEGLQTELIESRGPDLTPTLAQIAKAQNLAAQHLGTIQQHPALKMTPSEHGEAIRRAGGAALGEAAHSLHSAASSVRDHAQQLANVVGTARLKRQQLKMLSWTAAAAIVAGIVLSPFVFRLLPFGLDENIASTILRADRWEAGGRLMASANPRAWRELQASEEFLRVNTAALDQCRDAAAKTKKPQRCTLSVPAPE